MPKRVKKSRLERLKEKSQKLQNTLAPLKVLSENAGKIADAAILGGLAYVSYTKFKTGPGALYGPICLKLAQSENLAAGAAGVAGLALLGLPMQDGEGKLVSHALLGVHIDQTEDEEGNPEIEVTTPEGGKMRIPVLCEWTGPPGIPGRRCRCWYPGLGWHYVDSKYCES